LSILSRSLPLLLLSSLLCAAQGPYAAAIPANKTHIKPPSKIELMQIGVRSYPDGSHTPIWAVMLGDTSHAEQVARQYGRFGPYGLDATLWTRGEDAAGWVMTAYRRPRNIDEAMDWYKNAEPFISRQQGDCSLLPTAFGSLGSDNIKNIDFVIQYNDGSMKAYLYPGTSRKDAEYAVASLGGVKP
jgi:hypothetical protein